MYWIHAWVRYHNIFHIIMTLRPSHIPGCVFFWYCFQSCHQVFPSSKWYARFAKRGTSLLFSARSSFSFLVVLSTMLPIWSLADVALVSPDAVVNDCGPAWLFREWFDDFGIPLEDNSAQLINNWCTCILTTLHSSPYIFKRISSRLDAPR